MCSRKWCWWRPLACCSCWRRFSGPTTRRRRGGAAPVRRAVAAGPRLCRVALAGRPAARTARRDLVRPLSRRSTGVVHPRADAERRSRAGAAQLEPIRTRRGGRISGVPAVDPGRREPDGRRQRSGRLVPGAGIGQHPDLRAVVPGAVVACGARGGGQVLLAQRFLVGLVAVRIQLPVRRRRHDQPRGDPRGTCQRRCSAAHDPGDRPDGRHRGRRFPSDCGPVPLLRPGCLPRHARGRGGHAVHRAETGGFRRVAAAGCDPPGRGSRSAAGRRVVASSHPGPVVAGGDHDELWEHGGPVANQRAAAAGVFQHCPRRLHARRLDHRPVRAAAWRAGSNRCCFIWRCTPR